MRGIVKGGCPSGRTPRFLQPCILLLLRQKASYGYEIIEDLKKKQFMETKPDVGAIYRVLRKLETDGFLKSTWITQTTVPAKRTYKITGKGKNLLDEWAKSISEKKAILDRILSDYDKIKKGE